MTIDPDYLASLLDQLPPDVDREDVEIYLQHITGLNPKPSGPKPSRIWHYTSAEGLIGIISTGKLRATQIACLNDTMEHRALPKVLAAVAAERRRAAKDDVEATFNDQVIAGLADRAIDGLGLFVTCFSAAKDDLGQWRGYGATNTGFAIEFDTDRLFAMIMKNRPGSGMLGVTYDEQEHQRLAQVLLDQQWFLFERARNWSPERIQRWDQHLTPAYKDLVDRVYALAKHPSFVTENEIRIVHSLYDSDTIEFRAKQTLLARYIDADITGGGQLPITSVMVGPGGAQGTSAISVGDLLKRYNYRDVEVTRSAVPYRSV